MLFGIHLGLASATKCPEFNLDKDDAVKLADSVVAVMAFHKVKITPEQEAYGDLFIVASQVYPPMLMSVYLRKKMEAEAKAKNRPPVPPPVQPQKANVPPPPPANVTPLRSGPAPAFDPFKIEMPQG